MTSFKTVYSFVGAKRSFVLNMVDSKSYRLLDMLSTPDDTSWQAPKVRVVEDFAGRSFVPVDIPSLGGGADCANARARAVLEGPFADSIRFLPLICDREPFWLLHPTRVVDALDEDRSEMRRLASGLVTLIKRPVFVADRLPKGGLFRVPQFWPKVYAMQDFVDCVQGAGLTGLDFERVWSPEEGS